MKKIHGSKCGFPSVLPISHRCFHLLIASALTLASFCTFAFGQGALPVAPRSSRPAYVWPQRLFSLAVDTATQTGPTGNTSPFLDGALGEFAPQPLLLQTVVYQTFVGIDAGATQIRPPDPNCAVSADRIIQATNRGVAAFNKNTGATMWALVDLATFFPHSLSVGSRFTDPKVIYDRVNARFFVVALELQADNLDSYLHVAA